MNKPTEAGLYYARTGRFEWFNMIVVLVGESPFLRISMAYSRDQATVINGDLIEKIVEWSDRIPAPNE